MRINPSIFVLGAIGLFLASNSLYVVKQNEQALVLRLGQAKRVVNIDGQDAGIKIKVPFVENQKVYDRRVLDLTPTTQSEIVAADQERIEVKSFVRWQIVNPLQFYIASSTEANARDRISSMLEAALRRVLGRANSADIISKRRSQLMDEIRDALNKEAAALGVQIVDVRIRAAELPQANEERVFQRMKSEREQAAAQVRADGERRAQEIRGAADKDRAKIIADAYNQDADFSAFYRSMQAYEKAFPEGTNLVISPDSDFFRYFKSRKGGN